MANREWCRHYRAMVTNEACEIGIAYTSVNGGGGRFPCLHPDSRHLCASFAPFSEDEIAADEAEIMKFVRAMNDLDSRKSETCTQCGGHVESMEQVGRCVYARPCGCRLWQGVIPTAWR